ncbi:coiled-coil and C2 domain-containing protein 1B isoform X2 [Hemiscyllium ocellatum]|nr:coiled-coil and C2 domain-containing protein 1B isoform X2 [Hemiscyllium ocellatum]
MVQEEEVEEEEQEEQEEPTNPSVLIESAPDPVNQCPISQPQSNIVTVNAGLQNTLEERLQMYRIAISNAKQAGEMSKLRRYERGLKTLQTLLASANKGKKIEEAEIPPPVATGKSSTTAVESESSSAKSLEGGMDEMCQDTRAPANEALLPKPSVTELPLSSEPEPSNIAASVTSVQSEIVDVLTTDAANNDNAGSDDTKTKVLLVGRQKEYKLAALKAKQVGNITQAKEYMKISKKFDVVIKALDSGEPVDLTKLPPLPTALTDTSAEEKSLGPSNVVTLPEQQGMDSKKYQDTPESGLPPPPKDVVEALHQRMEKYKTAAAQAKADGNDRKARMHERIVKQYQDAIRAHKAGRKVDFSDLPIPPGFPPIPGVEGASGDHSIVETLETASRLVTPAIEENEEVTEVESGSPQPSMQPPVAKKPTKLPGHGVQTAEATLILPVASEERQSPKPLKKPTPSDHSIQLSSVAQQQLEFLQNRKKLYMKAAVQAKQKKNLEQAKHFLKIAKGFDPMIVDVQSGKSIDISKVPSPPDTEDDEFIIVHHKDVQISETLDEVYTHLMNLLKEQYEKCMSYSKQFIHLGNVAETTRFEKMAADCKISMQILKLGQARGSDPPKYHFEERTFKTVRIFSDISSAEMLLIIVKGINLPAPSGVATHDLDAFVKFEFPYPSTEQAQRHKTAVIKNTNCPEYNQRFVLNINRNHRGFKRVIQTKGIKFEIFHKGGFLRSDKSVGTAQLKLDKLETQCEVREIVEIFDGRKSTGGRLELKVQIREPLNGQDLQINTEKWLVLDPASRSQD